MALETKHRYLKNIIAYSFFISVFIGIGSNFFPSGNLQTLLWGLDAFLVIIGASLLGSKLGREDHDLPAAGFTVLAIANAMAYGFLATHDAGAKQFGAVIFIYVPGMLLISASGLSHFIFRILGFISAAAFGAMALMIYLEIDFTAINPLLNAVAYLFMNGVIAYWGWRVYKLKV